MAAAGFVHLLLSLWNCPDPARREELLLCLRRNAANPSIARLHLFIEEDALSWRDSLPPDRCTVIEHRGYPTFAEFIDHANRHLAGEVVAIANSDIHFDSSLERLRQFDFTNTLLALTRHNSAPYIAWHGRVWERNYGSQDAWIFRAPLRPFATAAVPGWFGCDGLLARELQQAGVRVLNPSLDVKAWHVHAARERVTAPHGHPKSHFPGNVDPDTGSQPGFRCLPIEPLGRWKVYTTYSDSHEELYRRWFLGTMKDDFDVVARRHDQLCETGRYNTDGWSEAVSRKIPLIQEAIDAHVENGFFIFADVDIQWLGPVQGRIRRLLAEQPHVDMFFQRDAKRLTEGMGEICTGFFVCKGNLRTRAFWTLVGECMQRDRIGDQITAQRIIEADTIQGLRVGTLPDAFWGPASGVELPLRWSPGMFLDPPADLLVHHANWTIGVPNKVAQLEYVARKTKLRARLAQREGKTGSVPVDHWAMTGGASLPPRTKRRTEQAGLRPGSDPLGQNSSPRPSS